MLSCPCLEILCNFLNKGTCIFLLPYKGCSQFWQKDIPLWNKCRTLRGENIPRKRTIGHRESGDEYELRQVRCTENEKMAHTRNTTCSQHFDLRLLNAIANVGEIVSQFPAIPWLTRKERTNQKKWAVFPRLAESRTLILSLISVFTPFTCMAYFHQ